MAESVATVTVAPQRDHAALAAGLTTVTLWGSAFVGIRAAGRVLSPGSITLGRLLVSCAILTAVTLVRRERLPARPATIPIALFGVLFLGGYSVTLNAAERHADAGTSAMIVNTGPLLIAVLAGVFLREGLPRPLLAGCCVALGGCLLIGLETTTSGANASGFVLLVAATLLYASAVVVQKVALGRATAFQVTWLGCVAPRSRARRSRPRSPASLPLATHARSYGRPTWARCRPRSASRPGHSRSAARAPVASPPSTT